MGVLDEETISRIKSQLRHHPKGMMISDLSSLMKINRNIMAKYLEILQMSGQVEMEMRGNAKVYTISRRAPLSALLESSSDCIVLLDGKGRILWVNAPVLSLTGKTTAEFTGKALQEIDDPFFINLPVKENPEGGETLTEISFTREEVVMYFRVRQVPAVFADGSLGSILSCEDVTSEVIFKQMVALSEARFRAIVEDQTEFIARFLPDGTLTFVNGSFARAVEKKPEELIGTQFFLHIHQDDVPLFTEKIQSTSRENAVVTLRCRGTTPDGQVRRLQWSVRALFDPDNNLTEYQAVGRDITEQAEAVARVRRHADEMEFIAKKIRGFMELPPEADFYAAIAEGLSGILPGTIIAVSSIIPNPADPGGKTLTIRNVCGLGGRELFRKIFGIDPVGFTYSFNDPAAIDYIKMEGLHKAFGDLYTCLFGQVPYLICSEVEKTLNLGDTFIHALVSQGELIGEVAIYTRKGEPIPDPGLAESFIRQASLVLSWRMANEALHKSEAQFRAIVEDQTEFIVRFLPDGTLTFANDSYARAAGKRPEELIGSRNFLQMTDEELLRFKEQFQSLSPDRAVMTTECSIPAGNGSVWRQQWTLRAIFDREGKPVEYQGVGREITDQAGAVDRLRRHADEMEFISRKAREFLELPPEADLYAAIGEGLSELLPDAAIGVSSCDPPSPVFIVRNVCGIGARETFRQITGTDITGFSFTVNDPAAIEFMKIKELHKAYGDLYHGLFGQVPYLVCRQIEEALDLDEIYILGLVSWGELLGCATILPRKGTSIPNPELIEAFLHQASLVLAWRKADEALRQSEERFRGIIEDQTEFVTRFLPDGTLCFANAPLCRVAGKDPDDLIGRSFFTMIPEDDRRILEANLQSLTAENPKMTIEHRFMDTEGRTRWFQWTNRAIFDSQEKIVEYDGIGQDITELHEAAERIRKHPAEIKFLSRNAQALAVTGTEDGILSVTARNIRSIVPGALVGICSYDPVASELSFRCLEGSREDLAVLAHELRQDPTGTSFAFEADPDLHSLFSGGGLAAAPGHIGLFFRSVSPDICTRVGERCNFGRSYLMGLPSYDGKNGTVLVQLKAGTDLQNPELIEAAISQADLALAQLHQR